MNNRLTFTWGVVPGRQVGTITKKFHKKRPVEREERAIMRAFGLTATEARRKLRHMSPADREADRGTETTALMAAFEARKAAREIREANKASRTELARLARLAKFNLEG